MSTEVPSPRKLNVEPATAEEIRAKYNTEANEDGTYDDATYEGQLTQEKEVSLTRAQQMRRLLLIGGATLGVGVTAMVSANLMGNAAAEKGPGVQPESTSSADTTPGANETTAPVASAEPSPLASPTNTTPLETAKPIETTPTLELSVDKYADKDALAKAILEERMSAWYMEGTTEENQESYYTRPEPWAYSEYVASAEKKSVPYIESLFTDDWSAHPETVEFIQRAKDMNAQSMFLNLATSKFGGNPENIEPYAVNLNVTSVQEAISENGNRLLIIDYVTNDNTELNNADKAMTQSIDNTAGSWKLELKQEGSVYKIASATL